MMNFSIIFNSYFMDLIKAVYAKLNGLDYSPPKLPKPQSPKLQNGCTGSPMEVDQPVKTESPVKSENVKVEPQSDFPKMTPPDLQNGQSPDLRNGQTVKKEDNLTRLTSAAQNMLPTGLTLTENHVETPIPSLLRGNLRDYQHIGLDWLVSLDSQDLNGILADEMGLGKTIQTISLLAHLACVKETWGPHLIVVPTSVLLNWDLEFKKWLPGFKVIAYYGSQKERKEKRRGWSRFNAFHVVVTSYNLAIADARYTGNYIFMTYA